MTFTKEKAKENLSRLIAKFERELAAGKISEYNEEAAKIAFIQPLLKDVLGWDVNDHDEVSPEERTSHGRVDYGLKVEGKIKIFVEAKPPKAELERHIEQAIRYGYNRKGVPFVLLTDFEALKLFDVTVKPDIRNPLKGLKLDLEYKQYLDQFDRIWQLSKESIVAGKLDELLRVRPKDRLPVDKAILEDLKTWREILAKNIFKNNQELFHAGDHEKGANYLKEIAQKILDRIIFMRSCEDRGLYHGDKLKAIFEERSDTVGTNTMVFLKKQFESYNIFFDSDLFSPQDWEAKLAVDFKVMKEIVLGTYNPYQFDVIPLEVLGNIYEQYLGYTIRLTDHQVKYELKPEVRKAGGIYYTPEYIVDYIVKNTVGKLLQELPPNKAKKLRILDPACGSGSFLIRAYEEMLNYYQELKTRKVKPGEGEKKLELPDEKLRLKIQEKKEILINHIFGVDIDEQAVEVTKLSLMLKMLDGERGIPAGRGILPMLDKNIKCGNSLISGNPLELHKYFGEDWYKVKPFNWEDEFPKIIKEEGGFDAVIGNPPYGAFFTKQEKEYINNQYQYQSYQLDSYLLILELSILKLINKHGFYGMIIPNPWLSNLLQNRIRKFVVENAQIIEIVHFLFKIFSKVTVDNEIVILRNSTPRDGKTSVTIYKSLEAFINRDQEIGTIKIIHDQNKWRAQNGDIINIFLKSAEESLKIKISNARFALESLCSINVGIKPYQIGKGKPPQTKDIVEKRIYDSNRQLNSKYLPYLRGADINRYTTSQIEERYLKYGPWLAEPRPAAKFDSPIKIIMRQTGDSITATIDKDKFLCLNNMHVIVPDKTSLSPSYLLGVINSKLINWFYHTLNPEIGEALAEVKKANVARLPIRKINLSQFSEKKIYDEIVFSVEVMLEMNKKIQISKGSEKDQIQRQIEKTDREIDDLVYKLYGITEEERRIIETEMKRQEH